MYVVLPFVFISNLTLVTMASRNNLIETIEPKTVAPSTAFNVGDWVTGNGAGEFVPLTPTDPVAGLCLEKVASTDPNYAQEKMISIDTVIQTVDRFLMPVGTGTATSEMEGLTFDVDAADAGALDVSAPGTQFEVTRFITASLVEVRVVLTA